MLHDKIYNNKHKTASPTNCRIKVFEHLLKKISKKYYLENFNPNFFKYKKNEN